MSYGRILTHLAVNTKTTITVICKKEILLLLTLKRSLILSIGLSIARLLINPLTKSRQPTGLAFKDAQDRS
jgi:hypothetical protein